MTNDSFRLGQYSLLFLSLVVLLTSIYFEFVRGLQPCPLCVMQRIAVVSLLILSLFGIFVTRIRAQKRLIITEALFCLAGLYFAGRQLWLQSLPSDQLGACLPGFDMLLKYFPWRDILQALFLGAADCAEVNWTGLGLSMPAWSALYFIGCFILLILSRYSLYLGKNSK